MHSGSNTLEESLDVWSPDSDSKILHHKSLLFITNRNKDIYKIYIHEKKIEIEYTDLIKRDSEIMNERLFSSLMHVFKLLCCFLNILNISLPTKLSLLWSSMYFCLFLPFL